jgi:hypothetical protein
VTSSFFEFGQLARLGGHDGESPRPTPLIAFVGRNDPIYDLEAGLEALLRWPKPGRGGPASSDAYQITRASSVNASASRTEGGTSVPRS